MSAKIELKSFLFGCAVGAAACSFYSSQIQQFVKPAPPDRAKFWEQVLDSAKVLLEKGNEKVMYTANISALIYSELNGKYGKESCNWCGFYFLKNDGIDDLTESTVFVKEITEKCMILGPFQGKPACTIIPFSKGVIGAACRSKEIQLVPDVHKFPGHIACDSASNSEIVIPIFDSQHNLAAVLDIDSPVLNGFCDIDQIGLQKLCALVSTVL